VVDQTANVEPEVKVTVTASLMMLAEDLVSPKETLVGASWASAFVKGCQMPARVAMDWQSGARIRGQASDKPRGTKPRGVGCVFQCAGILWGFE